MDEKVVALLVRKYEDLARAADLEPENSEWYAGGMAAIRSLTDIDLVYIVTKGRISTHGKIQPEGMFDV